MRLAAEAERDEALQRVKDLEDALEAADDCFFALGALQVMELKLQDGRATEDEVKTQHREYQRRYRAYCAVAHLARTARSSRPEQKE